MNKSSGQKNKGKKLEHWMIIAIGLMICDFVMLHLSYFLALWIRFDCAYQAIPRNYLLTYLRFITPYSIGVILLFWLFRMYRTMWRYASYGELVRTCAGSLLASALHWALITLLLERMPLSYQIWGLLLQLVLLVFPRFSFRMFLFFRNNFLRQPDESAGRVMIIGAGQSGQMLAFGLGHAGTVVDDRYAELLQRELLQADDNLALGILGGIAHQIHHHLLDLDGIRN